MSMTYQQFVDYATDLKSHSDSIDDGWSLCQYQCPMVKKQATGTWWFSFIQLSKSLNILNKITSSILFIEWKLYQIPSKKGYSKTE